MWLLEHPKDRSNTSKTKFKNLILHIREQPSVDKCFLSSYEPHKQIYASIKKDKKTFYRAWQHLFSWEYKFVFSCSSMYARVYTCL